VSSGNHKTCRLPPRGNRRINHAPHTAAITQIPHARNGGRACYDRKIAEGKTCKQALRCHKQPISDAVFARLQAGAPKATATAAANGPAGQPGNDSDSSTASSHPERQLLGQATPEPSPTPRPATAATTATSPKPTSKKTRHDP
jgi:transposase